MPFSYPERAVSDEPDSASEEMNVNSEQTVIMNCNLVFRKGESVGMKGSSGCGKSTLFKLLMGFYHPEEGSLSLEADSGTYPLNGEWRGLFAYVPQGNDLMHGTIRESVAFGNAEGMKDEKRLQEALYVSCSDGFVESLPDGIDTVLGERGAGLSEGQLQRLAIARAVFSGRPVLLLDEVTSALDEATEREVLKRIHKMTDKTVLIITHRRDTLKTADRVIECVETDDGTIWKTSEE